MFVSPRLFWVIIRMSPPIWCPGAQSFCSWEEASLIQNHSLDPCAFVWQGFLCSWLLPFVPLSTCPPQCFVRAHLIWFGRIQKLPFKSAFLGPGTCPLPCFPRKAAQEALDEQPAPSWGWGAVSGLITVHCRSIDVPLARVCRMYSQRDSNEEAIPCVRGPYWQSEVSHLPV